MKGETCDFCLEGSLKRRLVREYYRVKKGLVIMENVPTYVCDRCGERYYDADVAKQMRKLSTSGKQVKRKIFFPVNSLRRQEGHRLKGVVLCVRSEGIQLRWGVGGQVLQCDSDGHAVVQISEAER